MREVEATPPSMLSLPVLKPEDVTPCPAECRTAFPHHHFGRWEGFCYVGKPGGCVCEDLPVPASA